MDNSITVMPKDVKISQALGNHWTEEQVAVVKNSLAKGVTNTELAYFLMLCKSINLNPLNKEVWCYKDHRGNVITLTGRDGYLKIAQSNPAYNGIRSSEVHENDEFEMDVANATIKHNPKFGTNRGKIIGAYAIAFRKDGEPTIEWSDFDKYNKGTNKFSPWTNYPAEMIKKVSESKALKKAFGISGVSSEYDFDVNDRGVAVPRNTTIEANAKVELTPQHPNWANIKRMAQKEGATREQVEKFYLITDENYNLLCQ